MASSATSMITISADEAQPLADAIELMERKLPHPAQHIDLWRQDMVDIDGRIFRKDVLFARVRAGNYGYHCPIYGS